MKILCIEDGSVDIGALNTSAANNELYNKILVYSQGARPPYVLDFEDGNENISNLPIIERICCKLYDALKPSRVSKKIFTEYRESNVKNLFDTFFSQLKKVSADGELYYLSVKKFSEEERKSGKSAKLAKTGNLFCSEEDAEKVLEVLFDE